MTQVVFTHANTHREVIVTREMIFAIQYSEAHKATHIISVASAIIPIAETVEVARARVYGLTEKAQMSQGDVNGNA